MKYPRLFKILATFFGAGYGPVAPGTYGTIAAIPLYWILQPLGALWYAVFAFLFTTFACYVSDEAGKIWGVEDCQLIVIDEVAGFLVTMAFLPRTWIAILAGFIVFRILDSTKPFPIRWCERNIPGGAGVVLDDVVAGIVGCLLLNVAYAYWPATFGTPL